MSVSQFDARLVRIEEKVQQALDATHELRDSTRELAGHVGRQALSIAAIQGDVRMQARSDVVSAQDHKDIWQILDKHEAALNFIRGAVTVIALILTAVTLREVFVYFRG